MWIPATFYAIACVLFGVPGDKLDAKDEPPYEIDLLTL